MRHLICGVVIMLVGSGQAFAQTHPCDLPQATAFTVTTANLPTFEFCQLQTDVVVGLIVKDNGVDRAPISATVITVNPNAAGKIQYRATLPTQLTKGNHTIYVRAYNVNTVAIPPVQQEGPEIGPFALSVVDPPPPSPGAPSNLVIK